MRYAILSILGLSLVSPILVGCDREVSHKETQSQNPITGTTTTKDQSTYQRPDGSTYQQKSTESHSNP